MNNKSKYFFNTVSASFIFSALISSTSAQDLDSSTIAFIEAEARNHVETYYNYFYERNMAPLPEEIFNIPWILLGSDSVRVTLTKDEARRSFDQSLASLIERDWNRSIWSTTNVCVLNEGTAIVSGTNTRTKVDGSIMSVGGVSYFLGKTEDGWRIVSYAGHEPNRSVSC